MAAALDADAGFLYASQCLNMYLSRCDQCLTQGFAQLVIVSVQRLFCHVEHFSQGKIHCCVHRRTPFPQVHRRLLTPLPDSLYRQCPQQILPGHILLSDRIKYLCCLTADEGCV